MNVSFKHVDREPLAQGIIIISFLVWSKEFQNITALQTPPQYTFYTWTVMLL